MLYGSETVRVAVFEQVSVVSLLTSDCPSVWPMLGSVGHNSTVVRVAAVEMFAHCPALPSRTTADIMSHTSISSIFGTIKFRASHGATWTPEPIPNRYSLSGTEPCQKTKEFEFTPQVGLHRLEVSVQVHIVRHLNGTIVLHSCGSHILSCGLCEVSD